jgi:hypothetical protein
VDIRDEAIFSMRTTHIRGMAIAIQFIERFSPGKIDAQFAEL